MTRAVQINLKQRINSTFFNEQMVILQELAYQQQQLEQVSHIHIFVEENGGFSHSLPNMSKMSIAMHVSTFLALHKCFK